MPNSVFSLATSKTHWGSPFTFEATDKSGIKIGGKLTTREKVAVIALAIIAAIAGAIIGGIITFYLLSAFYKNRHIKTIEASSSIPMPPPPQRPISPRPNPTPPIIPVLPPAITHSGILPSVPKQGISLGLPNFTGNLCWLSSLVKFVASTDYFDELFDTNPRKCTKDENKAQMLTTLQSEFKNLIKTLRTDNRSGTLEESAYKPFVESIKKLEKKAGAEQLDSVTFLTKLLNAFNYPSNAALDKNKVNKEGRAKYVQVMTQWTGVNSGDKKSPTLDHYEPFLKVDLDVNDFDLKKGPINISKLYSASSDYEVRTDEDDKKFEEAKKSDPKAKPPADKPFKREKVFTNLPDTLLLQMTRIQSTDPFGNDKVKCARPIEVEPDKTIHLIEYHADATADKKATPKNTCVYRVEAAIVHAGTATGGHYICREQLSDDKHIIHNDGTVSPLTENEFLNGDGYPGALNGGTLLRLKLINKIPFQPAP